jgi:hypothetical protein
LELPPFAPTQDLQRDVVTIPGSGRLAITGWRFIPGYRSIDQVRVTDRSGSVLWRAWPEFAPDAYPKGTAIVVNAPFQFMVESFASAPPRSDRLEPATASQLEIDVSTKHLIELETLRTGCGSQSRIAGTVYGLQPEIAANASVEVRSIAQMPRVLGLFRGPTTYPLTYWLRVPFTTEADTMLNVLGRECSVGVIIARNRADRTRSR